MGRWTVAVLVVVGSFTRVLAQPIDPWADDPPPSSTAADPVRTPAPVAVDPPDAEDVVPEDLRAEPTTDPEDDVTSDEMISPSEVPIDDTADLQRYPRAFVERPLVLPHGIVELWAAARTARETFRDNWVEYGGASVGVTVGRGAYELGTGTDFLVFETDNLSEEAGEPPTFQRWHASAVVQVAPQTSLGVQGVVGVPMSRFRRYSPSLDVAHKFRPSPRGAIVVHGGVDYNYGRAGSNAQVVTHLLGAYAGAAVSVQVTPLVALRLGGRVAQYKYVDRFYGATKSFGWVSAGATILISISERADLSLFLGRSSGPVDTTSGGLTFTIRSSR